MNHALAHCSVLSLQFVPESARFYVVHGKTEEAEKVIRRLAWFNRRPVPKVIMSS